MLLGTKVETLSTSPSADRMDNPSAAENDGAMPGRANFMNSSVSCLNAMPFGFAIQSAGTLNQPKTFLLSNVCRIGILFQEKINKMRANLANRLDLGIPFGVNYCKRLAPSGVFADKLALFRFASGPNRWRRLLVRCRRCPKGRTLALSPFAKNSADLPGTNCRQSGGRIMHAL